MAKHGRMSCAGRSRHISIKYFWASDRVKQGGIDVHHCPTLKMLADYFTKPLQGKLFHKFCAVIMGWKHMSTLWEEDLASDKRMNSDMSFKERVGNNVFRENKNVNKKSTVTHADVVKSNMSKIVRTTKEDERRSCESSALNSSQLQLNPIVSRV